MHQRKKKGQKGAGKSGLVIQFLCLGSKPHAGARDFLMIAKGTAFGRNELLVPAAFGMPLVMRSKKKRGSRQG